MCNYSSLFTAHSSLGFLFLFFGIITIQKFIGFKVQSHVNSLSRGSITGFSPQAVVSQILQSTHTNAAAISRSFIRIVFVLVACLTRMLIVLAASR